MTDPSNTEHRYTVPMGGELPFLSLSLSRSTAGFVTESWEFVARGESSLAARANMEWLLRAGSRHAPPRREERVPRDGVG
jgi:hypothetical protein